LVCSCAKHRLGSYCQYWTLIYTHCTCIRRYAYAMATGTVEVYTGIPIAGLNPISLDIIKLEGRLLLGPKCRCKPNKKDKCPKTCKKNKRVPFAPPSRSRYTHTQERYCKKMRCPCVGYCWEAHSVHTLTHTVTHTHTHRPSQPRTRIERGAT